MSGKKDAASLRALMAQLEEANEDDMAGSVNDLNMEGMEDSDEQQSDEDDLMQMYNNMMEQDDAMINLRRKKANQAEHAAKKTKADKPFLSYGAGIQNYFVLQERLIGLFCWLTIMAIP